MIYSKTSPLKNVKSYEQTPVNNRVGMPTMMSSKQCFYSAMRSSILIINQLNLILKNR